MKNIENLSISKLEGWKWKVDIPNQQTHSETECRFYELHNKPLSQLDLSDVRFLIGQNSGLDYLIPYSISKFRDDIFLEAKYYPGDLLYALLSVNNYPNYWLSHAGEKQKLIELYIGQKANLGLLEDTEIIKKIKDAFSEFVNNYS